MKIRDYEQKESSVHHRTEIYTGRQFAFVSEKITLPNGRDTEMAFVRHPGSAVIVPLFQDNTIGLIKQYRHVVGEYLFEIPAGTMESHEPPHICAKRELEEETGFSAGQLIPLGKTYLLPAYSDEVSYVYVAKDLTKTRQQLDADEIIEVFQYPLNDIIDMIDKEIIIDALSILAIYRTMAYLKK
jgi:ADP-ribose pyrophosphatase